MSARSLAPRCAALVGTYSCGKTTLLEAILTTTETISRRGSIKQGSTVGDGSAEARERRMSVEVNIAHASWLGEKWCFLDCPGSMELLFETYQAMLVADVVVVVCEPDLTKLDALIPLLKVLEDYAIPYMIFVNQLDTFGNRRLSLHQLVARLQELSSRTLVLRQIPRRQGDDVVGYVDLVADRAYYYGASQTENVETSVPLDSEENQARIQLLEDLSTFDDQLLEQLLQDQEPSTDKVYEQLSRTVSTNQVVPVFLGAAERGSGVLRLLKALRHEVPPPGEHLVGRFGLDSTLGAQVLAVVFKTYILPHVGKLSCSRVLRGTIKEGMSLNGERVASLAHLLGNKQSKQTQAASGEIVALGRMDKVTTGNLLTERSETLAIPRWVESPPSVYALALSAERSSDEVKLAAALHKLTEEDPSLVVEQQQASSELLLWGQGERHLDIAIARLNSRYHIAVKSRKPQVPYRETIRQGASHHTRYKRQSGGHGQFADINFEIKPLGRDEGVVFTETVVGGSVPRQYIPAVEAGVRESLTSGPLGFPVVDVAVNLSSGQFHPVDSSEQAFKIAGRQGVSEILPQCAPVVLEPVLSITISVPSGDTSKVHHLVSGRRGQVIGVNPKAGWTDWDEIATHIPQAESDDLIIELRSLTAGLGSFTQQFDHYTESTGRPTSKSSTSKR